MKEPCHEIEKKYCYIALIIFFAYICCVSCADTSYNEVKGGGECVYIEKDVYLTFCLWLFKTSQVYFTFL